MSGHGQLFSRIRIIVRIDAGTGLLSPISYNRCNTEIYYVGKIPRIRIGCPSMQRRVHAFKMVLFTASRLNHWYREEGTGRGRSPPRLAVPNVTAHSSTASVPIIVFLYIYNYDDTSNKSSPVDRFTGRDIWRK